MPKRGLGKGLDALIPSSQENEEGPDSSEELENRINYIGVHKIRANEFQPRQKFDDKKLKELAASIEEHGLVQPVVVRPVKNGEYELIAGERRWRACCMVGLSTIPAVVKSLRDAELTEMALIENIQREDLNPVEEARAYKTLMEEYELTHDELSSRIGKSRSFISNMMRLLSLPGEIQDELVQGNISTGHARSLLGLNDENMMVEVCRKIIKDGLSVRQTENEVKNIIGKKGKYKDKPQRSEADLSPEIRDIQDHLQNLLDTKVKIKSKGEKGSIEISFFSDKELKRIIDILTQN